MTFARPCFSSVLAGACTLALATAAWAGGNHAGGHDTGIGRAGAAAKASRTITVEMSDDMRYTPANIRVKKGETVRFVVKNVGKIRHELGLGTEKSLQEHLQEMKKFPGMEHDEPNMVTLDPGKQGEIVWQFTQAGAVHFACLMPGHFEAGMKGKVQVAAQ